MNSLRTLKVDGTPVGIPVTNLYTDNLYKETSGDDSRRVPRFDWVTVIDEETPQSILLLQLVALIELSFPSGIQSKSIFFYMATDTTRIEKEAPLVKKYVKTYKNTFIRYYNKNILKYDKNEVITLFMFFIGHYILTWTLVIIKRR